MWNLPTEPRVPRLALEQTSDGGPNVRLAVVGEIDRATVEHFRDGVMAVLDRPSVTGVLLDLAALRFMDTSGVGVLMAAERQARERGVELRVVNAHGSALMVMEFFGVDKALSGTDP